VPVMTNRNYRRTGYAGRPFSTKAKIGYRIKGLFLFKNLLFTAAGLLLLLTVVHLIGGN